MTVIKKKLGSGLTKFVKYSSLNQGDLVVLGKFLGTDEVPRYKAKPKDPLVPQHKFEDEEGNIVVLNSAAKLDKILSRVEPGTTLEVVFLGKEEYKDKTGQTLSSNTFEVSELEAGE